MRLILLVLAALGLALAVWLWGFGGAGWVREAAAQGQREAQNAMAGALRAIRRGEPGALLALWGLCFTYGVAHAAGPGHGKLLIGGAGLSSGVSMAKLTGLSVASSLAQALTAIVFVYGGVAVLGLARSQVQGLADRWMATVSYGMIALVGLWLFWRGIRHLRASLRAGQGQSPAGHAEQSCGHDHAHDESCGHDHGSGHAHAHAHSHAQACGHDHAHDDACGHAHEHDHGHTHARDHDHDDTCGHDHADDQADGHTHACGHGSDPAHAPGAACPDCGHAHGPTPEQAANVHGLRDALALIAAIAIRPCTGALFLLIITWQMQIAFAGIIGALVMGLGTGLVTSIVAVLSIAFRDSALASAGSGQTARRLSALLEIGAGAIVALLAGQLALRMI